METKTLYLLVKDGVDGSYSVALTMDRAWIDRQQARYELGELEYDDAGVDADGFHYQTIQVPADATYESLGISPYHIARG